MQRIILFIALSLSTQLVSAQDKFLKDEKATQDLSLLVVDLFSKQKISDSFDALKPYWPMPENEMVSIELQTIKYMNIIEERYGETINFLKIKNEMIADFALRETYIIRYTNNAIRLIFTYYKNDNGWIVNAFKWDDSFTDEFIEQN
jgi:hypothetical protein